MNNDRKKKCFNVVSQKTLAGVLAIILAGGSIAGCTSAAAETAGQGETLSENAQQETAAEESAQLDSLLDTLTENANQSNEEKGKEETVYVFADSEGNVTSTIVSGWLKNPDKAAVLTDKTDLLEVFNVKGDESFEKNGDEYVWLADGNDIYYQGTTTKEAPVKVKITYYLNGKEISAEDLAGKSGKVKIRFDYENTQTMTAEVNGKEEEIYVPFAVVTGMILNDRFQNINVENGKLVSDGRNNVVIGFALPGLKESLALDDMEESEHDVKMPEYVEVSADVVDFELDMTLTVAASSADLSFDEALDFSDLDDKIDTLTDASARLKDGTNELADGILTLKDSMGEFSDGVAALKDGITEYTDGAARLGDGISQVKDGADSLDSGAQALADGIQTLNNGTKELKSGIDSARDGAQQLADGINGSEGAINGAKQLVDGAAAIKAGFDGIEGDPTQPGAVAASKQVSAGIKLFVTAVNAGTQEQAKAIKDQLLAKEIEYVQQLYNAAGLSMAVDEGNVRELAQNIAAVVDGIVENVESQAGQGIYAVLTASMQATARATADQVKDEAYLKGYQEGLEKEAAQTDAQEASGQNAMESDIPESDQNNREESENQDAESNGEDAGNRTESGSQVADPSKTEPAAENDAGSGAESDDAEQLPAGENSGNRAENSDGSVEDGTENGDENSQNSGDDAALTATAYSIKNFDGKADILTLQSGNQDKYGVIRLADGEAEEEGGDVSSQASAKVDEILKSASDKILTLGKAQGAILAIEQLLTQLDQVNGSMTQEQLVQVQQLMDGADALSQGLEQLSAGADQLYAGASKLNAGMEQLGNGANELTEGMGKLAGGGSDLAEGAAKLQDGSSELKDGTQKLKDGAGELQSGAKELTDNSAALKDGALDLAEGTSQVVDGVEELYSGAGELLDGMIEFDEDGIQKIADAYNGDVKSLTDRVRAVSDAGSAYDNFCGKQEDTKSSVKFIIRTEPVK